MKYALFFAVFFMGAFTFCKSKSYSQNELPSLQLRWGKGGGFTGIETTQVLLENGQVFQQKGVNAALLELEKVKKKAAKPLFEAAQKAGLPNLAFNYPGNTYQFIEFRQDGKSNRVTWGDANTTADPRILDLYKQLQALLPTEK
jgi:hypothetical protein